MLEQLADVERPSRWLVSVSGLFGATLTAGIERDHTMSLREVTKLMFPDIRRHAPSRYEDQGLTSPGLQVVEPDAIARLKMTASNSLLRQHGCEDRQANEYQHRRAKETRCAHNASDSCLHDLGERITARESKMRPAVLPGISVEG
jgi:hypothetical protein